MKEALSRGPEACRISMPEKFEYVVNYKDLKKAYQMSFFPGAERVDERTNRVVSSNYRDIVTAHSLWYIDRGEVNIPAQTGFSIHC